MGKQMQEKVAAPLSLRQASIIGVRTMRRRKTKKHSSPRSMCYQPQRVRLLREEEEELEDTQLPPRMGKEELEEVLAALGRGPSSASRRL